MDRAVSSCRGGAGDRLRDWIMPDGAPSRKAQSCCTLSAAKRSVCQRERCACEARIRAEEAARSARRLASATLLASILKWLGHAWLEQDLELITLFAHRSAREGFDEN